MRYRERILNTQSRTLLQMAFGASGNLMSLLIMRAMAHAQRITLDAVDQNEPSLASHAFGLVVICARKVSDVRREVGTMPDFMTLA